MAIDSAQRRQNALLDEMLIPEDTAFDVVDRHQLLGQYFPIPPTADVPWGGAAAPRPRADVLPAPRPRPRRVGHT